MFSTAKSPKIELDCFLFSGTQLRLSETISTTFHNGGKKQLPRRDQCHTGLKNVRLHFSQKSDRTQTRLRVGM